MNKIAHPLFSRFQLRYEQTYDTIIIGSGISGLALASILSKEGQKVLILERHYVAGGCTHTFRRGKYEWDVGLHYVGDVAPDSELKMIYDYICDSPIEWADMGEVYDRIYFGNKTFEFRKGKDAFVKYFTALFPEEKDGLEKYIGILQTVVKAAELYYAEKAVPGLISKIAGNWMRSAYMKYASRTTQEVMDELFTNDQLKAVLCAQFGDYGLLPSKSSFVMHATVASHYMEGGYYPVGGSRVILEKIAPVIKKAGGEIFVNAEVSEILVENGKAVGVKMADGKIWKANNIISTTGISNTYKKLLSNEVQEEYKLHKKLQTLKPSLSYCCLYVGFDETAGEISLPKSNYWIFPDSYDHTKNHELFAAGLQKEFPVVYISFPSAKDPDFDNRHPGIQTVEIITLCNYDIFSNWENTEWKHRGMAYNQFKEAFSKQLLEYLYKYLPQTQGKVSYHELSTPLSMKHFQNYSHGEMYGMEFTPERFMNKAIKARTPIRNLYLAGQDIVCAGVGGGIMSAIVCASAMKNKNYVSTIAKGAKRA